MFDIAGIVKEAGAIFDNLFTSDEERAKAQIALKELEQRLPLAQLAVNTQEAQHRSIFVAGWRPFIGWICGIGLLYDFLLRPLTNGFLTIFKIQGAMPGLDTAALISLLLGMLGLGGLRTYEKFKGITK